jgi:hypothetical protein
MILSASKTKRHLPITFPALWLSLVGSCGRRSVRERDHTPRDDGGREGGKSNPTVTSQTGLRRSAAFSRRKLGAKLSRRLVKHYPPRLLPPPSAPRRPLNRSWRSSGGACAIAFFAAS